MDKVQNIADTRKCALYSGAPCARDITVIDSSALGVEQLNMVWNMLVSQPDFQIKYAFLGGSFYGQS